MNVIGNDWDNYLNDEFQKDYFKNLMKFLDEEYQTKTIYPKRNNIYNALKLSSYENTKVVIIGQDPYHEPNQAHGLSFSVLEGNEVPPSLKNIYKELESDLGLKMPKNYGELTKWASQGVLLLNNVLTVEKGKANSHKNKGWEQFTDSIVSALNMRENPVIFVFWGNNAKSKEKLVTSKNHIVLHAPHPSPLSAYHGFFGCKHFSTINNILIDMKKTPIDWSLDYKEEEPLTLFDL